MVCLAFLVFACSRSDMDGRGVTSAVFPRMGVVAISSDFLDAFPSASCIFDPVFVGSACLIFLIAWIDAVGVIHIMSIPISFEFPQMNLLPYSIVRDNEG